MNTDMKKMSDAIRHLKVGDRFHYRTNCIIGGATWTGTVTAVYLEPGKQMCVPGIRFNFDKDEELKRCKGVSWKGHHSLTCKYLYMSAEEFIQRCTPVYE